jgi:hypothetical protein
VGQFISDLDDPRLEANCTVPLYDDLLCSLDEAKSTEIYDEFKQSQEFRLIFLMLYRRSNCVDKFIHFLTAGRRIVEVLLVVNIPILASSPFPSSHDITTGCLLSSFAFRGFLHFCPSLSRRSK